ncbi:MAG: alpha/beta hydrolase [Lapillicoccus sp.]
MALAALSGVARETDGTIGALTILELPDGRLLDLDVSGPHDGIPLVFHHGAPGSVSQERAMQRAAHNRGLRLVTFSRPGYGASTRQPGRRVVDAVADVAPVLAHLGTPRCLVAGWSGGGPHALATGARLREQVAGVLCIAGLTPCDAEGLNVVEPVGQETSDETGRALRDPEANRPDREGHAAWLRRTDAASLHGAVGDAASRRRSPGSDDRVR